VDSSLAASSTDVCWRSVFVHDKLNVRQKAAVYDCTQQRQDVYNDDDDAGLRAVHATATVRRLARGRHRIQLAGPLCAPAKQQQREARLIFITGMRLKPGNDA